MSIIKTNKLYKDLDWLREKLKTMTQLEIAKLNNVSEANVNQFIKRHIKGLSLEERRKKQIWSINWARKNKERMYSDLKVWRKNNPEKVKLQSKRTYQNNKDAIKAYVKKYRKIHKNYNKEFLKKWRHKNPLRAKTHYHKRRLLLRGLELKTIQQTYEDNIKQYGTLTCYLCELPIPFGKDHLEHKTPLSRGGTNEYNNLAIACQHCNLSKSNKTEKEYKESVGCKN